jgi:predicted transcriptional regulator
MRDRSDLGSSRETARTTVEEIAQRKGTFTEDFRREAENEAKNGRRGMLQAMEIGKEVREDFSKLLKM